MSESSDETKAARLRSAKVKARTAVEADVRELCSSRPKRSHECNRMLERCRQVLEALLECGELLSSVRRSPASIAVFRVESR